MTKEFQEPPEGASVSRTRDQLLDALKEVTSDLCHRRRVHQRFMALRVLFFLLAVGGYFLTAFRAEEAYAWYLMLPSLVLFVTTVIRHQPHIRLLEDKERLKGILNRRLGRLDTEERADCPAALQEMSDELFKFGSDGPHQSLDAPFLDDLGIFRGRANLFGLLWNGHTVLGAGRLVSWLKRACLDSSEATERRDSMKYLCQCHDLRNQLEQDLARMGDQVRLEDVIQLRDDDLALPGLAGRATLAVAASVAPGLFFSAFYFSSTLCFFLSLAAATLANYRSREALEAVPKYRDFLSRLGPGLRTMGLIEEALRPHASRGGRLDEIHKALEEVTQNQELNIADIEKRLRLLRLYKFGLIYVAFSWLTLFELFVLPGVLRRLARRRQSFVSAFIALAELDALSGISMVPEEQQGWTWPELHDGAFPLVIQNGLHPFLPFSGARPNTLHLDSSSRVLVITGSNMSGKSTFLKMCGLNQLLAQNGFCVRASAMKTSPHLLHTDINVSDSLDDGRSYFAVEVGRIKTVLDDLNRERPTFSLLDEMFRGTNTNEKVAAGIAVTRWIASQGGKALVATHDAPFTRLEGPDNPGILNFHFTETIQDGRMVFDYQLRTGAAQSSNAIRVLALEGYPEALVQEALDRAQNHDG